MSPRLFKNRPIWSHFMTDRATVQGVTNFLAPSVQIPLLETDQHLQPKKLE